MESRNNEKAIPIWFIEKIIGQYNDWNEDIEPLIDLIERWEFYEANCKTD